ncbi:hypothetical protein C1645_770933 [Glomus cerebriforme]|uniref:Uncharacterized protein n=1 Tax=Glomus cerebriforme TaxID=658196 RepID=A0A397SWH3_9GLOM|nr:hypothetical protein C1645_770933 [Glomus cerebriforme]
MMNKYRVIKDNNKRKDVDALAEELVINVIRIFYFRLSIQEPIAEYRWFKNNEQINKTYMKSSWDEDEIDNMVVEVCSFPLIYKPSPDAPYGFKVCTPAKVFPGQVAKQGLMEKLKTSIGRKFRNLYSSSDVPAPSLDINEDEYDTSSSDSVELN